MSIKYEIINEIAILSGNNNGWTKQLNIVSWNGRSPKYDLRDWGPNIERIGKGITLNKSELHALKETLNLIDID